jgi:probable rRNA maturation factor
MTIIITNRQRTRKVNARLLKQIVLALFAELDVKSAELGINLVGAREMARVNQQFLQHEGTTDVITFDHRLSLECPPSAVLRRTGGVPGGEPQVHGELFICMDDAVAQAGEFGTTWQSEIIRYAVHGVLHLLGQDDLKPALRRKMKREENRLLRRLGAGFSLAQLSRPAKLNA